MSSVEDLLADPASVGVWTAVPEQSTIGFKCGSFWGIAPVKGRFGEFTGDGQITAAQTVFGRVDIKATTVDTKMLAVNASPSSLIILHAFMLPPLKP